MQRLFFLLPLILFFTIFINIVQADELDQITQQINDLQKKLEMSKGATAPHEAEVNRLEKEMNTLSAKIDQIAKDTVQKEKDIAITEKKLEGSQKIFEDKVRSVYKKSFDTNLEFLKLFLSPEINDGVRLAAYHQAVVNKEKRSLIAIALSLKDLEDQKKELEKTKIWLAAKGVDLEKTAKPIRELVAGAKKYQASLTTEIAGLTAKQQALLAEKTASFTTSVGDVPAADDPASRPDYNPGFSPAYAGFSFGAPHRKGMSQYGAYGRAKNGQSAEDILRAYYGGLELKKDYSTGINITVQGYGTVDIETYVKRIYEVPNQWGEEGGMEALKAQAVAARSYALAYTNNGSGSICATESCQVYKGSNKGGKWEEAVNATRGWVLVANGKPFSTWYAATSGGYNYTYSANGYSTPGGWDTKCGSQSCWTGDAYEKLANSPWFYKAWYKSRFKAATRSHPWLNKDEFADIVNCVLLYVKDNSTISNLSQPDKDTSAWNRQTVRDKLGGDAIDEVTGINVSYSTGGYTNKITLQTNNGSKEFDGGVFREIFNIRSPGEIYLASALYNFEKK